MDQTHWSIILGEYIKRYKVTKDLSHKFGKYNTSCFQPTIVIHVLSCIIQERVTNGNTNTSLLIHIVRVTLARAELAIVRWIINLS